MGWGGGFVASRRVDQVWPADKRVIAFTDVDSGGTSRSAVDTAGRVLTITTTLDTGARFPVAGGILFLGTDSQSVDFSSGVVDFELGSSSMPDLSICLIEHLPGFTRDDAWQSARYECTTRELLPGTSAYRIPVTEFVTPAWWHVVSGLRQSQVGPERRTRILRIVFQAGEGTPPRRQYDLRIRAIVVRSRNLWILWGLVGLSVFGGGLHAGLILVRSRGRLATIAPEGLPSVAAPTLGGTIPFQPVEATSYADRERDSIIECIARDYPDAELTLERVARSTGVPLDRVTSHIKVASGLMFKAYLNRVRGEAARKLLLETDLPVAEVAQRVGYGSVPHFNRVFRELYETTPTALREGGRPTAAEAAADPA